MSDEQKPSDRWTPRNTVVAVLLIILVPLAIYFFAMVMAQRAVMEVLN